MRLGAGANKGGAGNGSSMRDTETSQACGKRALFPSTVIKERDAHNLREQLLKATIKNRSRWRDSQWRAGAQEVHNLSHPEAPAQKAELNLRVVDGEKQRA